MGEHPFASALATAEPGQFLRLERDTGRSSRFAELDQLVANVLSIALAGHRPVSVVTGVQGSSNNDTLALSSLSREEQGLVREMYSLSKQQKRGAWYLTEQMSLKAGVLNLPAHLRHYPWHAMTLATNEVARVHLGAAPDALAAWCLLIPLFDDLMAPITVRAAGSSKPGAEQEETWGQITARYATMGLAPTPQSRVFVYGAGWSRLDRGGQVRARLALLDELTRADPLQVAARFRAARIQALISATLKKSRSGTPLARKVLTKALQPVLSAYFGGDWLSYLDYVEMPPGSGEEIVTALPEAKLFVGGSAKAEAVAAQQGIDVSDVQAMLAAFLGQGSSVSPVEQRVDVLRRWWSQFDAVHARQAPGMHPLWGLVEDGPYAIRAGFGPTRQLYRWLLSPDLVEEVDRLWDGVTLPRWPETIVSEPYPHRLMAETVGVAAAFWHGVALTAWFVCEGPTSRTPLSGLRSYYRRHLNELAQAGTPIHLGLFDELEHAERYLGEPQPVYSHQQNANAGRTSISMGVIIGERRAGFERLRDIITGHRQGWSHRYLAEYLEHRWKSELTEVSYELNKFVAANGKLPTYKQFARFADTAANHWFNGDLAGLYAAIGERAPATSRRVDLLPGAAHDFVDAVYAALGGLPFDEVMKNPGSPLANSCRQKARLAAASVTYLQIAEALGRAPDIKEFGGDRHEWDWADGRERGWSAYQQAIEQVLMRNGAGSNFPGRPHR
ncbi:stress protein [Nonomuraea sp. FMUSA5-5]|uniref:Stress protein n=1 Tax=Nonomuraea composti TaxID=2720023 RepID=A0ABX1BLJ4_9ACTN|nr:stress protein [Nonomuraea sp. FMUSA5-5]NJP96649.1 stress protein [Nonomuraea sp. FMUSA5-5]